MRETMKLCVSCKACKRECPTGVDMARMKIEVQAAANQHGGLSWRDRLVGYLPRYAPYAASFAPLLNLRNRISALAWLTEKTTRFSSRRNLPEWTRRPFADPKRDAAPQDPDRRVALFADTFNRYFEPDNLSAAVSVLTKLGYEIEVLQPTPADGARPLCCGRTFLSSGLVAQARAEAQRVIAAAAPYVSEGIPIVGLEPSCLLSLRDEFAAMLPGAETQILAGQAFLFEEFLVREAESGRIASPIARHNGEILLHGHCHQKAFGAMGATTGALDLVEGLDTKVIETSCCGMAGSFGYQAETYDVSMAMAELNLLPAVRDAGPDTVLAADGFSCRHQIRDGTGRDARHIARILDDIIEPPSSSEQAPAE